jgi:hypothetical protein
MSRAAQPDLTESVRFGDIITPLTFAPDLSDEDGDWTQMIYVINLEDGGGQEFYLATNGNLLSLSTPSDEEPQEFRSYKLVAKKMDQLRERYPASCHVYALERKEFDKRRLLLQTPPSATE